jgi:hypothetical protein
MSLPKIRNKEEKLAHPQFNIMLEGTNEGNLARKRDTKYSARN